MVIYGREYVTISVVQSVSPNGSSATHHQECFPSEDIGHHTVASKRPNLSSGSGHRGQYQGGITLALFGSARWSLVYKGVFLIFRRILWALALPESDPVIS